MISEIRVDVKQWTVTMSVGMPENYLVIDDSKRWTAASRYTRRRSISEIRDPLKLHANSGDNDRKGEGSPPKCATL